MKMSFKACNACLCVLALTAGCATPQPLSFQLVDSSSKVQRGNIFPDSERIEVTIDGVTFGGFYITASGTAVSHSTTVRRSFPNNTVTTFSSNSARAHLTAENGQLMSCEFLLESRRALGECRTPAGKIYQLVADGN